MNFNNVSIVSAKGSNYRINFWYMTKDDAINIKKNSDLKKVGRYNFFFVIYKKWVEHSL